jgi:hypothetical protein
MASGGKARHKGWWAPLLNMKFDDPEQEAPFWSGAANNLVLKTPFRQFAKGHGRRCS